MKYLYKYPQAAFPYSQLVEENRRRDKHSPEFELMDTGVFADKRYFDVVVEYAKDAPEDILARITVTTMARTVPTCTCCRPSGFATRGRGETTANVPCSAKRAAPSTGSNSNTRILDAAV